MLKLICLEGLALAEGCVPTPRPGLLMHFVRFALLLNQSARDVAQQSLGRPLGEPNHNMALAELARSRLAVRYATAHSDHAIAWFFFTRLRFFRSGLCPLLGDYIEGL